MSRRRLWLPEAPHLMLRRHRRIALPGCAVRVQGVWRSIEKIHARTGVVTERVGPFPNLLLDVGLDELASSNGTFLGGATNFGPMQYCRAGTSNVDPDVSQTTLIAQIGASNSDGGFSAETGLSSGNLFRFTRVTRVFGTAEANGVWAEIGMASSPNGPMLTRQLILDAIGNPTTLTKTPDYQVRCVYEFRVYLPLGDDVYDAEINGVSRPVTARVGLFSSWDNNGGMLSGAPFAALFNGALGAEGFAPGGVAVSRSTESAAAYVPGSFQCELTATWAPSTANAGAGYNLVQIGNLRPVKIDIGSAITKTVDDRFVLEHVRSWARH